MFYTLYFCIKSIIGRISRRKRELFYIHVPISLRPMLGKDNHYFYNRHNNDRKQLIWRHSLWCRSFWLSHVSIMVQPVRISIRIIRTKNSHTHNNILEPVKFLKKRLSRLITQLWQHIFLIPEFYIRSGVVKFPAIIFNIFMHLKV